MDENPETTENDPEGGDALLDALNEEERERQAQELLAKLNEQASADPSIAVADEPAPPREVVLYRCKRGHIVQDMYVRVARKAEDDMTVIADTGPICRVCEIEWLRSKFAMRPYQSPQAQGAKA